MTEPLPSTPALMPASSLAGQTVVVTGAGGQLGGFLRPALRAAGAEAVIGLDARAGMGVERVVDITDAAAVRNAIFDTAPSVVIHAAAYTDVDGCERDPALARAVNADGSHHIASAARDSGSYLVAVSTDFVFSGESGAPYHEDAVPAPRSVYGATKLAGEQAVLRVGTGFAVARTAWLYGGPGKHFPRTVLTVVQDRGGMEVVDDEAGSPTLAAHLAAALVALAAARGAGIFHLANSGRATRFSLARAVVEEAGLDPSLVQPTTTASFLAKYPLPAQRPADSTLANTRAAALGIHLPPWRDAVAAYVPQLAAEMGLPGRSGPAR